jgi:hypothetical protein
LCKFVGIKCRPTTPFRQGRRVFRCVMLASDCMTWTCYCRRFRRIMFPPTSPFRDVRDIVFPISKRRVCKRASDDPEKTTLRFSISAVYWHRRWTYSRRITNIMLKITIIYVKDFFYRRGSWAGTPWARPRGGGMLKDMQVFSIVTVDVKGKWSNHRWIWSAVGSV